MWQFLWEFGKISELWPFKLADLKIKKMQICSGLCFRISDFLSVTSCLYILEPQQDLVTDKRDDQASLSRFSTEIRPSISLKMTKKTAKIQKKNSEKMETWYQIPQICAERKSLQTLTKCIQFAFIAVYIVHSQWHSAHTDFTGSLNV